MALMKTSRRTLVVTGLISLVAAPAIVRAGSLMPVRALPPDTVVKQRVLRIYAPDGNYVDVDVITDITFTPARTEITLTRKGPGASPADRGPATFAIEIPSP